MSDLESDFFERATGDSEQVRLEKEAKRAKLVPGAIVRWKRGIFEFHRFTPDRSLGKTDICDLGVIVEHETGLLVEVAVKNSKPYYRELGDDLEICGNTKDNLIG
jgi:hypothetical protein